MEFKWSSKRGRDLVFERSKANDLIKLGEPESSFLCLPGDRRNKIYNYLYEDKEIELVQYCNKTRFTTFSEKRKKVKCRKHWKDVQLSSTKDTCRQLYQETKGIFLPKARIATNRGVFAKFIQRKDISLHGRIRHVDVINGSKGLLRKRDVAAVLFPITDFCKSNPRVLVRIRLDDLIYDPNNPIAFIRTGMMLRKAFRNDRKFCFNDDKEATQEWRGGRNVAEVNVRNMRLLPACVQKFESVKILRGRVGSLLKKKRGDSDTKRIVEA